MEKEHYYTKGQLIDVLQQTMSYAHVNHEEYLTYVGLRQFSVISGIDIWSPPSHHVAVFRYLNVFLCNVGSDGNIKLNFDGTDMAIIDSKGFSDSSKQFSLPSSFQGIILDNIKTGAGDLGWFGVYELWKVNY